MDTPRTPREHRTPTPDTAQPPPVRRSAETNRVTGGAGSRDPYDDPYARPPYPAVKDADGGRHLRPEDRPIAGDVMESRRVATPSDKHIDPRSTGYDVQSSNDVPKVREVRLQPEDKPEPPANVYHEGLVHERRVRVIGEVATANHEVVHNLVQEQFRQHEREIAAAGVARWPLVAAHEPPPAVLSLHFRPTVRDNTPLIRDNHTYNVVDSDITHRGALGTISAAAFNAATAEALGDSADNREIIKRLTHTLDKITFERLNQANEKLEAQQQAEAAAQATAQPQAAEQAARAQGAETHNTATDGTPPGTDVQQADQAAPDQIDTPSAGLESEPTAEDAEPLYWTRDFARMRDMLRTVNGNRVDEPGKEFPESPKTLTPQERLAAKEALGTRYIEEHREPLNALGNAFDQFAPSEPGSYEPSFGTKAAFSDSEAQVNSFGVEETATGERLRAQQTLLGRLALAHLANELQVTAAEHRANAAGEIPPKRNDQIIAVVAHDWDAVDVGIRTEIVNYCGKLGIQLITESSTGGADLAEEKGALAVTTVDTQTANALASRQKVSTRWTVASQTYSQGTTNGTGLHGSTGKNVDQRAELGLIPQGGNTGASVDSSASKNEGWSGTLNRQETAEVTGKEFAEQIYPDEVAAVSSRGDSLGVFDRATGERLRDLPATTTDEPAVRRRMGRIARDQHETTQQLTNGKFAVDPRTGLPRMTDQPKPVGDLRRKPPVSRRQLEAKAQMDYYYATGESAQRRGFSRLVGQLTGRGTLRTGYTQARRAERTYQHVQPVEPDRP
jgi:hypothetical protein